MSLRKKTIVVTVMVLASMVIVFYAASRVILMSGFFNLERELSKKEVNKAVHLFNQNLANLVSISTDYAHWDDTYQFAKNQNKKYVTTNLINTTYDNLKLNFIIIVNKNNQIIFEKAYDLISKQNFPFPESLNRLLESQNKYLLNHSDIQKIKSGIIIIPEGIVIISSVPVLTSNNKGPAEGSLIFGYFLDKNVIENLSKITLNQIFVEKIADKNIPVDFKKSLIGISDKNRIVIQIMGTDKIAGYTTINDVFGEPALVLKVVTPRSIYRHGQFMIAYFLVSVIIIGAVFLIMVVFQLETLVLKRLFKLAKNLAEIEKRGDFSFSISVDDKKDELSSLSEKINNMLASLKNAQLKLAESEERYRDLFENANDLIQSVDAAGRLVYTNSKWKKIMGYSDEEIKNMNFLDIIKSDEADHLRELFKRVAAGMSLDNVETTFITKEGKKINVSCSISPKMEGGKFVASRGIFRDITEKKIAEKKLQAALEELEKARIYLEKRVEERTAELAESEAHYHAIVEDQTEMIKRALPDGRITFVNEAFCKFFDQREFNLVGKNFMPEILGEDKKNAELSRRSLSKEKPAVTYEYRIIKPGGEICWLEWTDRGLYNEIGELSEIQSVGRIITERKEAEKFSAIGQTATMVGHDLRNPLQVIINIIFLIRENLKALPEAFVKELSKTNLQEKLKIVEEQINYMNKIVSDLQDFARPLKPETAETKINSLIKETVATITLPANIKLTFNLSENLPVIFIDPALTKRVFTNLATNAIQAMTKGGELKISTNTRDESMYILFEDTGTGISEENLKNIFKPLFTTKSKGTGMGLLVSKRIIEAQGGKISVESLPQKGTTITIKLPLKKEAPGGK